MTLRHQISPPLPLSLDADLSPISLFASQIHVLSDQAALFGDVFCTKRPCEEVVGSHPCPRLVKPSAGQSLRRLFLSPVLRTCCLRSDRCLLWSLKLHSTERPWCLLAQLRAVVQTLGTFVSAKDDVATWKGQGGGPKMMTVTIGLAAVC